MGYQVSEQGMNGCEFLKLPEDEPHHLLDLFIGVEDHFSGGVSSVAGGDVEAEFAPASLGELALVHALLYDV